MSRNMFPVMVGLFFLLIFLLTIWRGIKQLSHVPMDGTIMIGLSLLVLGGSQQVLAATVMGGGGKGLGMALVNVAPGAQERLEERKRQAESGEGKKSIGEAMDDLEKLTAESKEEKEPAFVERTSTGDEGGETMPGQELKDAKNRNANKLKQVDGILKALTD